MIDELFLLFAAGTARISIAVFHRKSPGVSILQPLRGRFSCNVTASSRKCRRIKQGGTHSFLHRRALCPTLNSVRRFMCSAAIFVPSVGDTNGDGQYTSGENGDFGGVTCGCSTPQVVDNDQPTPAPVVSVVGPSTNAPVAPTPVDGRDPTPTPVAVEARTSVPVSSVSVS